MSGLKLVARSILTGIDPPRNKYLSPGGDILVLLADLSSRGNGPVNQTSIDIWSIRDPTKSRRLLRTRTKFGWVADSAVLRETQLEDAVRIVLACQSGDGDKDAIIYALESYDIHIGEVEPSFGRIVSESWQPIPSFPEWGQIMETSLTFSHWHAAIGDTIACTVQDVNRPEGDYDQSAGDVNEQLNPRFPLSGFEQIYLVDVSGPIGRWLHPRHVESFISAQAYIQDVHLYLLGRTASTYVVRDYHFSADMLLSPKSDSDGDNYLDLGSPLASIEGVRLPDPRVPWGTCDSGTVHFDHAYGFTILLLRDWYGEGQIIRLPLPRRGLTDGSAPRSTVHAFTEPHLPGSAAFRSPWLGGSSAIIYGEDDWGPENGEYFFELSFKLAEDLQPGDHERLSQVAEPPVVRTDLRQEGGEMPPFQWQGDYFTVDERSRCLYIMGEHAQNETCLLVFSLGLAPHS